MNLAGRGLRGPITISSPSFRLTKARVTSTPNRKAGTEVTKEETPKEEIPKEERHKRRHVPRHDPVALEALLERQRAKLKPWQRWQPPPTHIQPLNTDSEFLRLFEREKNIENLREKYVGNLAFGEEFIKPELRHREHSGPPVSSPDVQLRLFRLINQGKLLEFESRLQEWLGNGFQLSDGATADLYANMVQMQHYACSTAFLRDYILNRNVPLTPQIVTSAITALGKLGRTNEIPRLLKKTFNDEYPVDGDTALAIAKAFVRYQKYDRAIYWYYAIVNRGAKPGLEAATLMKSIRQMQLDVEKRTELENKKQLKRHKRLLEAERSGNVSKLAPFVRF